MDKPTVIRPKLQQSSVFLQTEDGVFFQSEKVIFRLKGKSIASWVAALSPYMDGERTLDELCNGFEPAQREMLTRLVNTLLQRGVLKDAALEVPEILPDSVRSQFAEQIAYIDHFTDQPQKRFKAFRESRLLLVGSGESLTALALSLMRNGLREIFLLPTDGSKRYSQVLESEAGCLRQGGSEVYLSIKDEHFPNELERLEDYDGIVYSSDNNSLKELAELNEHCIHAGRPFLSATIFAGQAMLGPFTRSQADPCWLCAQLRLSAWREVDKSAAFWKEFALGSDLARQSDGLFTTIARRIGHGLGLELFKIFSGALPSETEQGVILQDLEILQATSCKLTQHPLCPVCTENDPKLAQQYLLEIVHGKYDHELTQDQVRAKYKSLFDPEMGSFREQSDADLQQIPLKVVRIVSGQAGSTPSRNTNITAYAIDHVKSAGSAAFMRAIKNYTMQLPDRRGMLFASPDEMTAQGHKVILPRQLATWTGGLSHKASVAFEWVQAFSVRQQTLVYVPAAAVYPQTMLNRLGTFEKTFAGTAVAQTWRGTFEEGLLSALGYMHLQELIRGKVTVAPLDLEVLSLANADLAYLVKSAQRFERPFTCLQVLHQSPLSIFLVHTTDASDERLTTYGIGLSDLEAARMALLDFVGGLQMLQTEGHLPVTIHTFCPGISQDSDRITSSSARRFSAREVTIKQIEDYLQETERDALFVNMTPSDIRNKEGLISGMVLLTFTESDQRSYSHNEQVEQ